MDPALRVLVGEGREQGPVTGLRGRGDGREPRGDGRESEVAGAAPGA